MLSSAELASITATVASALDVTVTVQRTATGKDAYGHDNGGLSTVGTPMVNIYSPSGTYLQAYASLIGSQKAMMIRFLQTTDIRRGDIIIYNGQNWEVQRIDDADSYTVANDALITRVG